MRMYLAILLLSAWGGSAFGAVFPSENTQLKDLGVTGDTPVDEQGNIIVGDMLFPGDEIRVEAAVVFQRWTNGKFVFRYSDEVTTDQRVRFRTACEAWISNSALTCVERTNEPNYAFVRTHNGNQCGGQSSCSFVGMTGGAQDLFVLSDHWTIDYILQHEIGHALGFLHEHQRPDRDGYILVLEGNISSGSEDQFTVYSDRLAVATDYDFYSIMHYPNCAFSKHSNCSPQNDQYHTIQALSCSINDVGGSQITDLDRQGINAAYAASLAALYVSSRNNGCASLSYNRQQWQSICADGSCSAAGPVQWRKVVERYYSACGFIPAGTDRALCAEIKREFITSWTDSDEFSCGRTGLATLNEIWSQCGCSFIVGQSMCSSYGQRTFADYSDSLGKVNWQQGRTVYFYDIVKDLLDENLLDDDLVSGIPQFIGINYLDKKYESRLAAVRAAIYSYAHWKRTIQPDYKLDVPFFNKVVQNRKLRPIPSQ